MFEVGFSEILLIMVIALIVLGPERLPKLAADVGRWMGRARSMARQLRSQLDQEVQLDEMLREQKPASSYTPAAGAAAAGTAAGAGATAAASATAAEYGAEATAPPPPAASDPGTHVSAEGAVPPPGHVPPAFANPPAVGPGAPEVGAPTDDLHSHGHEAPATAPAAWDDPSLAPSSYSPERVAAPAAADALAPSSTHDPRDVARHS
jgi:sec-independent protein translocase protein TatB